MNAPAASLLLELAASGAPFALISRDAETIEVLTGDVHDVDLVPVWTSKRVHRRSVWWRAVNSPPPPEK